MTKMSGFKAKFTAAAVGLVLCAAFSPIAASAAPDPAQVQALATQIENALAALGPNVSVRDAKKTIRALLKGSYPDVAEAALDMVEGDTALSPAAIAAATSVDTAIASYVSGAGGQGGGAPLGAPASYASGGGSDYLKK